MGYRPAVVLLAGVACGRIAFDPRSASDGSAAPGDALPACGQPLCPDPTFGSDGIVRIDVGGVDNATFGYRGIAERPDGRLLVAGMAGGDAIVVGLTESGARDPAFGSNGVVAFDAGGVDDEALGLALFADGEVAVAGSTDVNGAALVARVGSAGLDAQWNGTGISIAVPPSGFGAFNGVIVDASGRVIAGGQGKVLGNFDLSAGRMTPTGTIDGTFRGGVEYIDLHGLDEFGALAGAGPGSTYYLVGQTFLSPFFLGAIVRLASDGNLDPTFGGSGSVSFDFGAGDTKFYDLQRDASDRLVVAGATNDNLVVTRFLGDGSFDPSFGSAGSVIVDRGASEALQAVAVAPDGRIAVGGFSGGSAVVGLLDGSGTLQAMQPVPVTAPSRVASVIVDHAGRVLVFGSFAGSGTDLFVARFRLP